MGLFDDLLKKPKADTGSTSGTGDDSSSGSTGGNPPVSDPLATAMPESTPMIQKSEEVSIVTESYNNTATSMPPAVTVSAIDDASSIIIGSPSSISTEITPVVVTSLDTSVFSNMEVTPVATVSVPMQDVHDVGIITAPVEEIVRVEQVAPTESSSLMNLIGGREESTPTEISIAPEQSIHEIIEEVPAIIETEAFAEEETPVVAVETPGEESPLAEPSLLSIVSESSSLDSSMTEEETYEHPTEFIEASIARIDSMIARIDDVHNAKLEEALGYKAEKEKYTTLEEQAYADAEKYVTEKEHAVTMRTYFVDQGKAARSQTLEAAGSVETTLTGLAVQNAVSETVKHDKKTKAKKEEKEETLGLLGL